MADILVYGGGFQAVAAAAKAANNALTKSVLVVVPSPVPKLGDIATIGGQNYWDTRLWNGGFVQSGTFEYWYNQYGSFYNTDEMAALLLDNLAKYNNVEVLFQYDISAISTASNPFRITSVTLKSIYRDADGNIKWGSSTRVENVSVVVDASTEGRIARKVNSSVTTGRYDWPAKYLTEIERNNQHVALQQAATLMFKVKGVVSGNYSDMNFTTSSKGVKGCWGGNNTYKTNKAVVDFNNKYGPQGFMLKGINAAQNGLNSDEWWINAFLIFNVDGRANYRDIGTEFYPDYVLTGSKTTDEAWIAGREFLKNNAEFLNALRQFDGFSNVDFVCEDGYPVVGEVLYIRETVHMAIESTERTNQSENNYEVTTTEELLAGSNSTTGSDIVNYASRIGLAYYNADVHPYTYEDMLDVNGNYISGLESYRKMRPDLNLTSNSPDNPVYVPYLSLTTNYVANLLLPGYATGVSSFVWGEVRVFPNLCVLGDAVGIAAAYCINCGKYPLYLDSSDIASIQTLLANSAGARLNK